MKYRDTSNPNYAVGRRVLDGVWNESCDHILTQYVERYGTYLMAFADKIIAEIEASTGETMKQRARYYEYYLLTRAYEMPYTRRLWLESLAAEQQHTFSCIKCGMTCGVLGCHPKVIARQGINPICCLECSSLVDRYDPFKDEDIRTRLVGLVRSVAQERACDLCHVAFNLKDHFFTLAELRSRRVSVQLRQVLPVDLFLSKPFANVCPDCFREAFQDHSREPKTAQLAGLYQLFLLD